MSETTVPDQFETYDRVYLEKLRLATGVLLEAGEDPGIVNDIFQTELFLFRDRVDRALLLPATSGDAPPRH